jgi:hypothetical protein
LRGLGVRGFDDLRCLLSSALLPHGFGQLARRAVEDVNHYFEVELMDQAHRAVAMRAGRGGFGWGHGTTRGVREQAGELGGALSLGNFFQFAWSAVDGVLELITAGFTRPYVSDAVVVKVLRPFWLAQARTALGTLIRCQAFHRCFLHMWSLFRPAPKTQRRWRHEDAPISLYWYLDYSRGRTCNRL